MPAPTEQELTLPDSPARAAGPSTTEPSALNSRGRRELILFLVLLACGLFVVPLLIWGIGQWILGPYAGGSAFALLADFFTGLKSGSLLYWTVVFGPYVFVLILRAFWYLMQQADRASD
jgi:hypothetical protein